MTEDLQLKRLEIIEIPKEDDSCWIKDLEGNVIGYKNVRYMEELKLKQEYEANK